MTPASAFILIVPFNAIKYFNFLLQTFQYSKNYETNWQTLPLSVDTYHQNMILRIRPNLKAVLDLHTLSYGEIEVIF